MEEIAGTGTESPTAAAAAVMGGAGSRHPPQQEEEEEEEELNAVDVTGIESVSWQVSRVIETRRRTDV